MDRNLFATVFAFNNLIFQTLQSESYKYWVVGFFFFLSKRWNFVAKDLVHLFEEDFIYVRVCACIHILLQSVFYYTLNIISLFSYDKRDALLAFFRSTAVFILLYPHRNQGLKIIWGLPTQIRNNFPLSHT